MKKLFRTQNDNTANFDKPADLVAAEMELHGNQQRQQALAKVIADSTNALSMRGIVATAAQQEDRRARLKAELADAERDLAPLREAERDLVTKVRGLREQHKAAVVAPLKAARLAGAQRYLAAIAEVRAAHDDLDRLRAAARASGLNVREAILPMHLPATIGSLDAIVRECEGA